MHQHGLVQRLSANAVMQSHIAATFSVAEDIAEDIHAEYNRYGAHDSAQ